MGLALRFLPCHPSNYIVGKMKKLRYKKKKTRSSKQDWNILTKPHVLSWKFWFQSPLANFLWNWRTCSRYLKCSPGLNICVSEKIVTTRHTNQILCQEKWKKIETLTKWSSKWGWNILTKPHILSWNFFSKASRNFLTSPKRMLKVSKRCPERSLLRS